MLKLFMYRFKGNNRIEKYQFEVKEVSKKTAFCYIPIGETYNSFYKKFNMFPPIEEDLNIISEVGEREYYTMFTLENNDKFYEEKLREALQKTYEQKEKELAMLKLDIGGRYKFYQI